MLYTRNESHEKKCLKQRPPSQGAGVVFLLYLFHAYSLNIKHAPKLWCSLDSCDDLLN
jgi:hypothetical protein